MGLRRTLLSLAMVARACGVTAAEPVNVAPQARVTSDSEYSGDYLARFVTDGVVPEAGGHDDLRHAWCVQGDTHRDGATLTFEWPQPVTVAALVYYGRVAWYAEECWKDVVVEADDRAEPLARATLQMASGPQVITLPHPIEARRLRLRFVSSYGGPNPGASEIQVWTGPPPAKLGRLIPLPRGMVDPGVLELADLPETAAGRALHADLASGRLGFERLLVVQRREINPSHVYTYHVEGFSPGGALCLWSPATNELQHLVDSPDGQILDADLSFDGRTILFSWRRTAAETYHLYTIGVEGGQPRQLTAGAWHDFNACWLPDGGIAFLSTRTPQYAYCWVSPVGTLYRMEADGSRPVRLSANYLNDFTPSLLPDGRLIYGRWEYVDRPAIPIQSLWTLNPDGTGLRVFYGNRVLSPATFIEPRAVPGSSRIVCTMTAHNGPCRGAIGLIEPARGENSPAAITNLTPEVAIGRVDQGDGNQIRGPYESPYPLDDHTLLVTRRGALLLRSFDGSAQTVLLAPRDGLGFYAAQPVRSRPLPPARPSLLPEKPPPTATVFLEDVYQGLGPSVARGDVIELAVVQELAKSELADVSRRAFGFQFPVVSCGATYAPKKVWGHVPVAPDGSATFTVPSGVPLYFLALDRQGRAVQRMRSFTHFMPGEVQGCVGCHEGRQTAPLRHRFAAAATLAQARPPQPPEWGLDGFSYADVVQPVLDRHCTSCHNASAAPGGVDLSGDRTDFFNVSYDVLTRTGTVATNPEVGGAGGLAGAGHSPWVSWIPTYNGTEESIPKIVPRTWGSPVSKLAELVLAGHPDAAGRPRVALSAAEQRRILMWIDLNVPYYGTSLSTNHDRLGCRRLVPATFEATLADVARRRCAGCHAGGPPRTFYLRVTRPEHNAVLMAPLAKAAGGRQSCGQPVFANANDADYRRLLATFEPLTAELRAAPREDMPPGATGSVSACLLP